MEAGVKSIERRFMICAVGVDKMGKAYGTYGREKYSGFWWEKPKKDSTWEYLRLMG
jgi:hypothetical protein